MNIIKNKKNVMNIYAVTTRLIYNGIAHLKAEFSKMSLALEELF